KQRLGHSLCKQVRRCRGNLESDSFGHFECASRMRALQVQLAVSGTADYRDLGCGGGAVRVVGCWPGGAAAPEELFFVPDHSRGPLGQQISSALESPAT